MQTARLILLFAHIISFSAVIGALVLQTREPKKHVTRVMRDGAGIALVTGLALVVVIRADGGDVDGMKIAAKLGVAVVLVAVTAAAARRTQISQVLWALLLVLAVADVGLAVFWAPTHGSY